jgi:Helix-turn-helix domain
MNDSIGARLRQARESRRLTLQQVSETTKVRPHYLQALENDDLSAISSVAQARGFLRIYAEFLGLSPADLVPAVATPVEPPPPAQPSVSSTGNSTTVTKAIIDADKPPRPGLLTNFLNRFIRPADKENASTAPTKTASSIADTNTTAPESFIPARVTEVMPENIVPAVVSGTPEIKIETAGQDPIKDAPKTRTSKKLPPKPRKSSADLKEQNEVKKKVGG